MTRSSYLCGLAIAIGVMLPAAPASAAKCNDMVFSDSVKGPSGELVLNGLGLRKATFLRVKVYVVGLYLPEKSGDAGKILSSRWSWRLELRFLRGVDASDMKKAFHEGFEDTGADLGPLKSRIDALVGMFVDFKEGQALAFTNDLAKGVAVELDGAAKGAVEGADFAAALLAIWLGHKPANEQMKAGMLGGVCER